MSKEIRELLDFLYGHAIRPSHMAVQMVEKDGFWYPGNKITDRSINSANPVGFTGRIYETYSKPKNEQSWLLAWFGIDIDDIKEQGIDIFEVNRALYPYASTRLSKSGNGLHCIFKIKPVLMKVGDNPKKHIEYTLRQWVTENVDKSRVLTALPNVRLCSSKGFNFFLYGGEKGKNRWLSESDYINELQIDFSDSCSKCCRSKEDNSVLISEIEGEARDLVLLLQKEKELPEGDSVATKYEVHIKSVYRALKGTPFEFTTKSPMKTKEWHINGFITISHTGVRLWSFADNGFILDIS